MDIQIIVDSCCDLTPALRNLLRVSVASLKIDVGSIPPQPAPRRMNTPR